MSGPSFSEHSTAEQQIIMLWGVLKQGFKKEVTRGPIFLFIGIRNILNKFVKELKYSSTAKHLFAHFIGEFLEIELSGSSVTLDFNK